MIKVGLSGNRYAGKDAVSKLFEQIRVPVFDADRMPGFFQIYLVPRKISIKMPYFV